MTSLFTAFVARGIAVPEIDPRLMSHVDVRDIGSEEGGPAAPADDDSASVAPAEQASEQAS